MPFAHGPVVPYRIDTHVLRADHICQGTLEVKLQILQVITKTENYFNKVCTVKEVWQLNEDGVTDL